MTLWAVNLPRFYSERVVEYNEAELVNDWVQSGRARVLAWNCGETVRYLVRDRPDVRFVEKPSDGPFLLVSTRRELNADRWWGPLNRYLQEGYTVTLIDQKSPAHPESLRYSGSLYFPPNGLWVYRLARAGTPAQVPTTGEWKTAAQPGMVRQAAEAATLTSFH